MWFREAFQDQINPAWENVHLDQLDEICDKIEAAVGPDKQHRGKAIATPGALTTGAKQQLYYQSMKSFFDNDEEAPEALFSFSHILNDDNSIFPTESTGLLSNVDGRGPNDSGSQVEMAKIKSPNSSNAVHAQAPSSVTLRAYLQRENSLSILHSAATPFNQLSPQLQKLETFYSALFLADCDQTNVFFKNMQGRVQNELLFLFAKSVDVLKAKHNIHTIEALHQFLISNPDHSLSRAYKLMQHYCEVLSFFQQSIPVRIDAESEPLDIDQELAAFICGHITTDNNIHLHSRTVTPNPDQLDDGDDGGKDSLAPLPSSTSRTALNKAPNRLPNIPPPHLNQSLAKINFQLGQGQTNGRNGPSTQQQQQQQPTSAPHHLTAHLGLNTRFGSEYDLDDGVTPGNDGFGALNLTPGGLSDYSQAPSLNPIPTNNNIFQDLVTGQGGRNLGLNGANFGGNLAPGSDELVRQIGISPQSGPISSSSGSRTSLDDGNNREEHHHSFYYQSPFSFLLIQTIPLIFCLI